MNYKDSANKQKVIYVGVGILLMFIVASLPFTSYIENFLYGLKMTAYKGIRSNSDSSSHTAVIKIDDDTVSRFGFPIQYKDYLALMKKLKSCGAKGVALVTPLESASEEQEEEKARITQFIQNEMPTFLTYYFSQDLGTGTEMQIRLPDTRLLNKSAGKGFVLPVVDSDGVMRKKKLALVWSGKILPSIELSLTAHLKNVPVKDIKYEPYSIKLGEYRIRVNQQYEIKTVPLGNNRITQYGFSEFMKANPQEIKGLEGKIVLIAPTASRFEGYFPSPIPWHEKQPYIMGVAGTIENIMSENYITDIPGWANVVLLLLSALTLAWLIPSALPRKTVATAVILTAGYITVNILAFIIGFNFPLTPLLLHIPIYTGFVILYRYYCSQSFIRRFVPEKIMQYLREEVADDELASQLKRCTILFADIKGYTTLSERYNPALIIGMLNEYIQLMNHVIANHGGLVMNYQGDGLLAVFGLGDDKDSSYAYRAVLAGIEMQETIEKMRRKWIMEHRELFVVGIGIATGDVAFGALGTQHFMQYVAIGDTVNLSARLQGLGKKMRIPIMIDDATYNMSRTKITATEIETKKVKGKFDICKIYAVDGLKSKTVSIAPGVKFYDDEKTALGKKVRFYQETTASDYKV